jgi:hypothetical protein
MGSRRRRSKDNLRREMFSIKRFHEVIVLVSERLIPKETHGIKDQLDHAALQRLTETIRFLRLLNQKPREDLEISLLFCFDNTTSAFFGEEINELELISLSIVAISLICHLRCLSKTLLESLSLFCLLLLLFIIDRHLRGGGAGGAGGEGRREL